jgi:hypothetical protein
MAVPTLPTCLLLLLSVAVALTPIKINPTIFKPEISNEYIDMRNAQKQPHETYVQSLLNIDF